MCSTTASSHASGWSFHEYADLRDRGQSLGGAGRVGPPRHLRLPDGSTELELANVVSLNVFAMTGVSAAVGRVFTPADDRHG